MSNPGVISLASNPKLELKIEDNIGEAIHIHYRNIRLDLTIAEFEKLSTCMENVIDGIVSVNNLSCSDINTKELVKISTFLTDITKATTDEVYLKNLLIETKGGKYVSLEKHINSASKENNAAEKEQIILFENKNFVICGQEYCKKLYSSLGDIKIPVTRIFFDNSISIKDLQKGQTKISILTKIKKLIKKK